MWPFSSSNRGPLASVAFATACWERDWRPLLLDPLYLPEKMIGNHRFPFQERLLIINNVKEPDLVAAAAQRWLDNGVLTRILFASHADRLAPFGLTRADFTSDWLYYNALAPFTALAECQSSYLLYHTGDVRLDQPVDWIPAALRLLEKDERYAVANLTWNGNLQEVKRESYRKNGPFYVARQGFSDQQFLLKASRFRQPFYREIRPDASHYPRGDVFEKRLFCAMKNRGWERLIYSKGSYTHANFPDAFPWIG